MLEACVNPGSGKKRSSQQVKRVAHRGPWKTPTPCWLKEERAEDDMGTSRVGDAGRSFVTTALRLTVPAFT